VRTATLQLLDTSEFQPDFVGERLEEWTWVVYPWNFIEDMIELVEGVMKRADDAVLEEEAVRGLLRTDPTSIASRWDRPARPPRRGLDGNGTPRRRRLDRRRLDAGRVSGGRFGQDRLSGGRSDGID